MSSGLLQLTKVGELLRLRSCSWVTDNVMRPELRPPARRLAVSDEDTAQDWRGWAAGVNRCARSDQRREQILLSCSVHSLPITPRGPLASRSRLLLSTSPNDAAATTNHRVSLMSSQAVLDTKWTAKRLLPAALPHVEPPPSPNDAVAITNHRVSLMP